LEVGSKIEYRVVAIGIYQNNKERKVDGSLHPFSLRSPCCTKDRFRHYIQPLGARGFHLRQIAAEIADDIRALEIPRKANKRPLPLAARTVAVLDYTLLAEITEFLADGCYMTAPFAAATNHEVLKRR
jgi:hypothetical protein